MPEWLTGLVVESQRLTESLATFRLMPGEGTRFPVYEAGQYIALRRDHCRLTHLVLDAQGTPHAVAQVTDGRQVFGPVSHPYSIVSAPYEAAGQNYLEFYISRGIDPDGAAGRFSSSLFEMETTGDHRLSYVPHMSGTFTLADRALGAASVLMVATGTGIAPFISMIRQLDYDARSGKAPQTRYTLIYANRTIRELAYHGELRNIEAAGRLDLVYVPSLSRPSEADGADASLGHGRANNLLRHVFGVPLLLDALGHVVEPALPAHIERATLAARLDPASTVLLTCGNPASVADVRRVGTAQRIRVETEDW